MASPSRRLRSDLKLYNAFGSGNDDLCSTGSDFQIVKLNHSWPAITYQLKGHSYLVKCDTKGNTNHSEREIL